MTLIRPLAQTLRDCLEESLGDRPNPLPAERVQVRFGAEIFPDRSVPQDECCPGIAWVRPVSSEPRFNLDDDAGHCVASLRRSILELTVYRCMPTPGPGELVTRDQWDAVFIQAESDHSAIEAALCCFSDVLFAPQEVPAVPGVLLMAAMEWTPIGPDANCVGQAMQVMVEHGCACGTEG